MKRRTETNYRNWATFFRAVQWALQPVADRRGLLLFSSAGLDELGAPLYGIIIYLQCQIAVLRSNAEKQRFKFLIVSAPAARPSFAAAQRKYLRDLSALCHGEGL